LGCKRSSGIGIGDTACKESPFGVRAWKRSGRIDKELRGIGHIDDPSGIRLSMDEEFVGKAGDDIDGLSDGSSLARNNGRSCEKMDKVPCLGFGHHSVIVSFDVGEDGIPGGCIRLLYPERFRYVSIDEYIPFPIGFELVPVSIGKLGVGVFFSIERIGRFLAHLGPVGADHIRDAIPYGSLVPENSSGVGDGEGIVRGRIGT